MRVKALKNNYPSAVPVGRIYANTHDLAAHVFGNKRTRFVRARALRFLIIAGAVELYFLADRIEDVTLDRIGFILKPSCTDELKALAWKAATSSQFRINEQTVPQFLEHGINTRPRGRPRLSPGSP